MLINGLELESDDFDELRYLVDWKIDDLYEQMKDDYYDDYPDELEDLKQQAKSYDKIQEFLSKLYRGTK